jgi:hypothetical protein
VEESEYVWKMTRRDALYLRIMQETPSSATMGLSMMFAVNTAPVVISILEFLHDHRKRKA